MPLFVHMNTTLDSPDQGAMAIPLGEVSLTEKLQ